MPTWKSWSTPPTSGSPRARASRSAGSRRIGCARPTWASRLPAARWSQANVREDEIDLIICATITPDMPFPATACLIQQKLGAKRAAAFDMEAACSGFLYGLEIGQQFITSGTYNTVLVIGAEKLSTIIDWQDRSTCVLFGDGAGAAILRSRGEEHGHGILTTCMGADGSQADILADASGWGALSGFEGIGERGNASFENGRQRGV
jgi:3-oxoacyl-[acyl-carrier-protein] synthase III